MLHTIIVILLVGIVIALVTGFYFFYQDKGRSKRVMYALAVRVSLALILMAVVFYGLSTGEITFDVPWSR